MICDREVRLTLPLIHHRLGAALLVSFVCKDLDFTQPRPIFTLKKAVREMEERNIGLTQPSWEAILLAGSYLKGKHNWIPVEERLPKFDEQVLVYGLCPNGCRLFYVDCLIQDINDNGYPKWDDDTIIPTHWMPLPQAPKEEEEK